MKIRESSERAIGIELAFIKPLPGTSTATFTFANIGDGTRVTWAMDGENTLLGKVAHIFFDMDEALGAEFERGLGKMKNVAEHAPRPTLQAANRE